MQVFQVPSFNKNIALSENELKKIHEIEISNQDIYSNLSIDKKIRHQVLSRKKVQKKLPTLHNKKEILYPVSLSVEQSSSEITANYKASLIKGKTFVDLTTGMGIDSLFIAKQFEQGILIERNKELAEIDLHNFFVLNQTNVKIAAGIDSIDFINQFNEQVDLIYIDPARRNELGNKVVSLSEYEPNVISILDRLFAISTNILIKTSPLLDISKALIELKFVKEVHVISVDNECKELVFQIEKEYDNDIKITTINFDKKGNQLFEYLLKDEKQCIAEFAAPLTYLYEPNASIMKAGAFKMIGEQLGLKKMHPHTHLYTSDHLVENFPGRTFKIEGFSKFDKKEVAQMLPEMKANIAVRNFPISTNEVKKKFGIKDGGDIYLFVTTNYKNEKIILFNKKVE
jgi:16S rRNA G966 N2-methylase RsmD